MFRIGRRLRRLRNSDTVTELRTARSREGFPVRVTSERWAHITESHDYMAGYLDHVIETIEDPDWLVKGWIDEFIAMKHYAFSPVREKYLVVVYKDLPDGFVITAFMTSKYETIVRRGIIWEK